MDVTELEIHRDEHLAVAQGRSLALSSREVGLLEALVEHQGRVVRREELYRRVWGTDPRPEDRSVDVYVHKLRAKFAQALPEWQFIHTHFGLGYRFAPEKTQGRFPT